jgi:hypothetical protein
MTAAREMFSKSYFSLGAGEKGAVDQAVMGILSGNYTMLTAAFLAGQESRPPMGFESQNPHPPRNYHSFLSAF